jgi:hypothetical protein
MHILLDV